MYVRLSKYVPQKTTRFLESTPKPEELEFITVVSHKVYILSGKKLDIIYARFNWQPFLESH